MPRIHQYEFDIRYNHKTYHVIAVYRPPNIEDNYASGDILAIRFDHNDLSSDERQVLLNEHEFLDAVTIACQDRYGSSFDDEIDHRKDYGGQYS